MVNDFIDDSKIRTQLIGFWSITPYSLVNSRKILTLIHFPHLLITLHSVISSNRASQSSCPRIHETKINKQKK